MTNPHSTGGEMQIIPLRNTDEREYQKARIDYKRDPSLRNFERLRHAYLELCDERKRDAG